MPRKLEDKIGKIKNVEELKQALILVGCQTVGYENLLAIISNMPHKLSRCRGRKFLKKLLVEEKAKEMMENLEQNSQSS